MRRGLVAFAVCLVALAGAGTAVGAPSATLTPLEAGDRIVVRVAIANPDDEAVRVLRRAVGADGLMAPAFAVTRAGRGVAYVGPIAKFGEPAPSNYLTVPAHDVVTYDVDLSRAYAFDASAEYAIRLAAADAALVVDADGDPVVRQLGSPTIRVAVAGRPAWKAPDPAAATLRTIGTRTVSYSGCAGPATTAGTEQQRIAQSLVDAEAYAREAVAYFGDRRAGARYQTWFGAYDATRWQRVRGHYTRALAALVDETIEVVCHDVGCTSGVFAFVFPNQPYRVFVCGAFWSAGATGTDSRAGTMIHEIMHFTVIAGTDDHVYGQTDAAALAISNPGLAADNSDNHEYFSENTPAIADNALAVTVSDTTRAFGSATVGTVSDAYVVTVENTGDLGITVGAITAPTHFAIDQDACSSRILAVAATCSFAIRFAPVAVGAASGAIAIPSDATVAADAIAVSGTGVAPVIPPPSPAPLAAPAPPVSTVPPDGSVKARIAVRIVARSVRGGVRVAVPTPGGPTSFRLEERRGGRWVAVPGRFALRGGERVLRLTPGVYRVVTAATATHAAGASGPVRVGVAR
jgi:peptidyl-Lys metalloendopeptidase